MVLLLGLMVCFPLTGLFAPLVVSRICETHALLTENGAASVVQMASACVAGAATARLSGVGATLGMVRDTRRALSFGVGTPGSPYRAVTGFVAWVRTLPGAGGAWNCRAMWNRRRPL